MLLLVEKNLYVLSLLVCTTLETHYSSLYFNKVSTESFPFIVRLQYVQTFICSGSILNSDFILTAASCVYKKKLAKFKVYLVNGDNIYIKSIKLHEKYKGVGDDDIAILKTQTELPINSKFVKLASISFNARSDEIHGVLGNWYNNSYFFKNDPPELIPVVIYNNSTCSSKYILYDMLKNMCIAPSLLWLFSYSCPDNSGGPVVVKGSQVGIIGETDSCDFNEELPKIVTMVSKYLVWIDKNSKT